MGSKKNFARVSKEAMVAKRSENVASKNRPDVVCVTQTVFQQDGAPSHRAKLTVCSAMFQTSSNQHCGHPTARISTLWTILWGALQQMVYRDSVTSLNDLKEKIRHC